MAMRLARQDWGDAARPVDLIFIHANGFNGLTYRTLLELLADDWRILAPDLRGHGSSPLSYAPEPRADWREMLGDLTALIGETDGPPLVLAGHSMGGTLAILAAAQAPERVRCVMMLDPVILDRAASATMRVPGAWRMARRHPWARAALKRRRRFDSLEAAVDAYRGRGAFRDWPDAVLKDYVAGGFHPAQGGGVDLACTPEWESSNYSAQANDAWGALKRFEGPIRILKAEQGSTCSVGPADAARLGDLSVEIAPGGTHFFPMIQPDLARAFLAKVLEA